MLEPETNGQQAQQMQNILRTSLDARKRKRDDLPYLGNLISCTYLHRATEKLLSGPLLLAARSGLAVSSFASLAFGI